MRVLTAIALAFGAFIALVAGVVIGAVSADDPMMERNQWEDPDLGPAIAEGVATEQHLWLLGWNGGLVRFDRDSGDRLVLGARVQDILADGRHLWAVSILPDGSTFEVRDLRDATLPPRSGQVSGDLLQLIRMSDGVGVLTQNAVFLPSSDGLSPQAVTPPLYGWATAAASGSGSIYAGRNSGEFGGGLTRIDPRDGSTRQITGLTAAQEAAGGCEGDFNPDCDPIVGVLPDPQRPDCIIAASGQFHLGMTHGKVYRVCGDDLSLTYETPNRTALLELLFVPYDYWRSLTAPIESLTQTSEGWVAISSGRYFRMRNGQVREHPMPDFRLWSGLRITDEQDGVLLAVAACCSGVAFDRRHWTIAIPVIP